MRKRGRKSKADLAQVDCSRERLSPPACLGSIERGKFIALVGSCDPQQFRRSDLPLLCRYVEADALAERAARELSKSGPVVAGKANAWLIVQEKAVRAMVALSMRLRVSPQSRTDPKTVGRKAGGVGVSADDYLEG